MKAIHFVFCLFAVLMLTTTNSQAAAANEDFQAFLKKFTSSASFQYSRIKFPLKTPIALLEEDGETEKTFPFTRDKWALLGEDAFKEERITDEEGGVYVSRFTVNTPKHKEFEAGYDESEASLRVVFELIDGKWYVTDCSFSLKSTVSLQCGNIVNETNTGNDTFNFHTYSVEMYFPCSPLYFIGARARFLRSLDCRRPVGNDGLHHP